jgi:hypothetical protein
LGTISHSQPNRKVLSSKDCARRGPYGGHMRRRKLIKLIGGVVVAWPLIPHAQSSALPVIGFLNGASPDGYARQVAANFRKNRDLEASRTRQFGSQAFAANRPSCKSIQITDLSRPTDRLA